MAFDTDTRNRLQRFVSAARKLLTGEFTKQFQSEYGIDPESGEIADLASLGHLDDARRNTAYLLREIITHYQSTEPGGQSETGLAAAMDRVLREQAFTVLNRFAALRMAEERKLILESIRQGEQSEGFQIYQHSSGTGMGERYQQCRAFLFSVFDELSLDLGVLFDRFSPHGMLFPRPDALGDLLELINSSDLAPLWAEDETIGWIYQYWNSKEERKAMRDASAAPRNSRELAVRNQFFTPRYVVEFLTDNTLGRIWYEMTKGRTRLADQCRYLVRRPTEIFLAEGEDAPPSKEGPDGDTEETLSQEELLKQPVHILHRAIKDPREIRLLDPACGSMHFGLYAFDLFEAIYEESWDNGLCPALQEAYSKKDDYLRDVPRLIIEHNIHGVDIDPRAVQIAGLSLWLRAQKTWKDTPAAERPRVRRSNIVCAEPMPGSDAMLEDFVQTLDPPLLGELVKTVFDKMQLAGEAGTLLKIEEEIRTAIDDAKAKWEKLGAAERDLFSAEELNQTLRPGAQQALTGVEKALTTDHRPLATDFFDTAEERIYAALRDYAESAEAGDYQRRLFAEDAAHGFAFIDLCRKRYEAVVMNPPFGEPAGATLEYLNSRYSDWNKNILCAFVVRAYESTTELGSAAAIFDRTAVIKSTYDDFRSRHMVSDDRLRVFADLGWEVLDANVEVTTSVLFRRHGLGTFVDARNCAPDQKGSYILEALEGVRRKERVGNTSFELGTTFQRFPNVVIGYDFPEFLRRAFASSKSLREQGLCAYQGHALKSDKHFRVWWECRPGSSYVQGRLFNGAGFSPFKTRQLAAVVAPTTIQKIPIDTATVIRNPTKHLNSGVCFGKRGEYFAAHLLPRDFYFTMEGQAFPISNASDALALLGYLNTPIIRYSLNRFCGQHKTSGYVNLLPYLSFPEGCQVHSRVTKTVSDHSEAEASDELSPLFNCVLINPQSLLESTTSLESLIERALKATRETEAYCESLLESEFRVSDDELEILHKFAEQQPPPEAPVEDVSTGARPQTTWFTAHSLTSYTIGASLGRWDIRYATGDRQPPELPDPFDPLPVCPPGMLQNADGLPAAPSDVPADYPLPITWPGILVSDPGHPEDIVARVRDALAVIWGDHSAAIEQEACEILGVRTLRDYFAEKKSGGKFFKDHLKRYSKSRRQAPIYWPLSTESGTYTLWIYYHRLTDQTLFTAVNDFVAPKIEQVGRQLTGLRAESDRSKAQNAELERLIDLEQELQDFRTELLRLAELPWKPDLNDGVQITAAPLWKLFRLKPWQKKLKETWQKLEKGDYDWAHLAYTLWPDRVREKCKTDKSLAIAHGLEDLYIEPPAKAAKKKRAKRSTDN